MHSRLRLAFGAAVLATATFAAPLTAYADAIGNGGGNDTITNPGGSGWIVGSYEERPGCDGTEVEIGSTLAAPPDRAGGEREREYWGDSTLFLQRRQRNIDSNILGQAHCVLQFHIQWGGIGPTVTMPARFLANAQVTATASFDPDLAIGDSQELQSQALRLPTYKSNGAVVPWSTVVPVRKLVALTWSAPACFGGQKPGKSVTFIVSSSECADVAVTPTWELSAHVYVQGSTTPSMFRGLRAGSESIVGWTTSCGDVQCTMTGSVSARRSSSEIRAVYTNSSTGASGGEVIGGGGGGGEVVGGGGGGGFHEGGGGFTDGGDRSHGGGGGTRGGGGGTRYACTPGVTCVRDLPRDEGLRYEYVNGLRCALGMRCDERLSGAGFFVSLDGTAGRSRERAADGTGGQSSDVMAQGERRKDDGSGMRLGGLGLFLLVIAVLAVASFLYFGRRQRL